MSLSSEESELFRGDRESGCNTRVLCLVLFWEKLVCSSSFSPVFGFSGTRDELEYFSATVIEKVFLSTDPDQDKE